MVPVSVGGEGSAKEKWPLLTLLSERAATPALAQKSNNSVLPLVSRVPFELRPQCWSSVPVSPINFLCGSFRRNAQDSRDPLSHSATIFFCFKILTWQYADIFIDFRERDKH